MHIDPPLGLRPVHVFTKQFQPSNLPVSFIYTCYGSKFLTIKFTGTFYGKKIFYFKENTLDILSMKSTSKFDSKNFLRYKVSINLLGKFDG